MTPRAQAGFTLVELSVVLLVVGLAAGAVALRVQGPLAAGRLDGAVAALEQYDSTVRHWCARHGRQACVLWDMEAGRASLVDASGAALPAAPLRLPEGFKVAEMIVGGRDVGGGRASVAFGTGGMTSSYAVLIADGRGRRAWVMFCGLTGQAVRFDTRDEAIDAFHAADIPAGTAAN